MRSDETVTVTPEMIAALNRTIGTQPASAGSFAPSRRRRDRNSDRPNKLTRGGSRRKRWIKVYRIRNRLGLERCRRCGTRTELSLDHLIPWRYGGTQTIDNTTILCRSCNSEKDTELYGWWDSWPSLADEENAAPTTRRWSKVWPLDS